MANSSYLQIRTNESDKEQACAILEELGTNISAVVNMLLKQIIMTKGIPFEVKLKSSYTKQEIISEVQTTMSMEHMPLDANETAILKQYQEASELERSAIRKALLEEFREE